MKILFLTTHFNTGGITSYVLTMAEGLVKSGHQVVVISSGGNCVGRLEALGIRHVTFNIRTKSEAHPKLWWSFAPMVHLIRKEKVSIIHAQTRVTQVLGAALSRPTGVKMITTCHGFFRARWFRKTFPCWGKAVIAISKPVAHHLYQDFGVPQNQIHLITNGLDLNRFVMVNVKTRQAARQKMGLGDVPLIGIVARLSDVKGIDILIKAMPLVLKKIPLAKLMIVGQGAEEPYLKELVRRMSLTEQVHFKNVTEQTQEYLPGFDVFVLPSLMEGLGLSAMEAQACGIPVVATRVGGLVDVVEDGKTGYLVPARDEHALAVRIVDVLLDAAGSKLMAQQARLNIEEHFTADLMIKKTLELYEQYSRR
jgi:glycosyltransferase involved in cell wall biosynthesis